MGCWHRRVKKHTGMQASATGVTSFWGISYLPNSSIKDREETEIERAREKTREEWRANRGIGEMMKEGERTESCRLRLV